MWRTRSAAREHRQRHGRSGWQRLRRARAGRALPQFRPDRPGDDLESARNAWSSPACCTQAKPSNFSALKRHRAIGTGDCAQGLLLRVNGSGHEACPALVAWRLGGKCMAPIEAEFRARNNERVHKVSLLACSVERSGDGPGPPAPVQGWASGLHPPRPAVCALPHCFPAPDYALQLSWSSCYLAYLTYC